FHSESANPSGRLPPPTPALLMRISSRPRVATVAATILRQDVSSATSTGTVSALAPAWRSARIADSFFASSRPANHNCAPSRGQPLSHAKPNAPVTAGYQRNAIRKIEKVHDVLHEKLVWPDDPHGTKPADLPVREPTKIQTRCLREPLNSSNAEGPISAN